MKNKLIGGNMKELYERYGALMIQKEIIDSKIYEVKQMIAGEMSKPKQEDVEEEKKEEIDG